MKKLFIAIAALALVASAACTKVNPEEKKSDKIRLHDKLLIPVQKSHVTILTVIVTTIANTFIFFLRFYVLKSFH